MIPQGFPLYAVDKNYPDSVYVVVGWVHGRTPMLAPIGMPRVAEASISVPDGRQVLEFTTERPGSDDLRERMARLADEIKGLTPDPFARSVARAIREELAR